MTQSGERWRWGLELGDLKGPGSDIGEVGSEVGIWLGLGLVLSSDVLRLSGGLPVK